MAVPIFFAIGFAACIIGAYHKPHPNSIKLAVVGPAAETAPLRSGLARAAGPAFEISPARTVAHATSDVRHRVLDAAFVPAVTPSRPATMIVASSGGRLVATAAETLGRSATAARGAQLAVRDVRPLPAGDEIGLGVFLFIIVCTVCGYIAPAVIDTAAPALWPGRRFAILGAAAVLVPTLAYLIGGLGYGTYNGSAGTIFALIGIAALYMFTISLGTRMFEVLLGPPGILASLALLVFLNIASLGATYTAPLLAPFWHFLNRFWIGAGAVNAERSILYFGGLGIGTDVLRLVAWTVVAA
ncbi:MAG: hypothetical protein ACYDHT_11715, partial [Solirubrobacteraceae bacterium]